MELIIPVVNFSDVRRAQLAKSTLITSTVMPLGSFQIFLGLFDSKQRVECGMQREASVPIQSLVKLQPWFLPEFVVENLSSAHLQPGFLRLK